MILRRVGERGFKVGVEDEVVTDDSGIVKVRDKQ